MWTDLTQFWPVLKHNFFGKSLREGIFKRIFHRSSFTASVAPVFQKNWLQVSLCRKIVGNLLPGT